MTQQDIGDFLEVPEGQREDVDPPPEYNADSGFDVQVVPDGEVVTLTTADPDESAYDEDEELEDFDGAPLQFADPGDPDADEYEEED